LKPFLTAQEIETIHGHLTELNHDATLLPFAQFSPRYLRVQTKSGLIVPLELNRMQLDLHGKLTGRDLVIKARQMGLSTLIQARQFRRVAYEPCRAAALAHDAQTTTIMRAIHRMFYDYLPESAKPERDQNNASTITYKPHHGRVTLTTAGNPDAGIGTTYNDIHGTEVSRWKDAQGIISGLLQGLASDGAVVFESTPYGARGLFYQMCMEALDGNNAWTLHFYPWWWDEGYQIPLEDGETLDLTGEEQHLVEKHGLSQEQIKWRRAKIQELPHTFKQEYPEDVLSCFLSGGNSVFGDFEFCLLTQEERQTEPIEGHRYMGGVDWGQEDDYTTLSIIDATDDVEVFVAHWNKMPWDEMQNQIVSACGCWNVETIQPEKNSMGSVNIENLHGKFIGMGLDVTIRRITMTNRLKQKLVSNLRNGIDNDGLKLLNVDFATSEMRTFISKQLESGLYKFEHAEGAHDDTVIARMLAWDACCKMI
jgi:hypothetical protein